MRSSLGNALGIEVGIPLPVKIAIALGNGVTWEADAPTPYAVGAPHEVLWLAGAPEPDSVPVPIVVLWVSDEPVPYFFNVYRVAPDGHVLAPDASNFAVVSRALDVTEATPSSAVGKAAQAQIKVPAPASKHTVKAGSR